MLANPPGAHSDGHHCFDLNKDGKRGLDAECAGWHEWALPLPSEASHQNELLFNGALLNWSPHGHIPPGAYEGHATFYEEMVTVAHLASRPDICFPIKQAAAVALSGRYPTLSCIRYRPATSEVTVSLEGFEQRAAAPPVR